MTDLDKVSHNSFEERLSQSFLQCLEKVVSLEGEAILKRGESPAPGASILVAVSGGPDSTSLLLALVPICQRLSLHLTACHINHGQRATESEGDEEFCRALCQEAHIPFVARKMSLQGDHASEELLRDERHRLLEEEAQSKNARLILFGHTADDQVETIFFRFLRGTALKGLTGIKNVRATPSRKYLVRPMLALSKSDCLDYLAQRGIAARLDSSNDDDRFSRNFLRLKILPLINERFKGFGSRVETLRTVVEGEEAFFADYLPICLAQILVDRDESGLWSRSAFARQPIAIKRRLLALTLNDHGQLISFERIENLIAAASADRDSAVSLDQEWRVRFHGDSILWQRLSSGSSGEENALEPIAVRVPGLNMVLARNSALKVETLDGDTKRVFPAAAQLEALVDLTAIKPPLVVRSRQSGDLITPLGMNKPVRLKRYLQTHKKDFGGEDRMHIAVVADSEEVIWVPGVGLSAKVGVRTKPTHRLSWLKLSGEDSALV